MMRPICSGEIYKLVCLVLCELDDVWVILISGKHFVSNGLIQGVAGNDASIKFVQTFISLFIEVMLRCR